MTATELGKKLKEMYDNAPRGEQVTMVHLFSIKYHEQIKEAGVREVVEEAGVPSTFRTEVNKGVKLAKYVLAVD